jgi:hypothetical protein
MNFFNKPYEDRSFWAYDGVAQEFKFIKYTDLTSEQKKLARLEYFALKYIGIFLIGILIGISTQALIMWLGAALA